MAHNHPAAGKPRGAGGVGRTASNTNTKYLAESFLSFLGLGVQEPLTSLGTLISKGAQDMELAPWLLIFPSIVMVVTLMSFNFIGDGLRDAIDPKDR